MTDERFDLESQLREVYGRVIYTHKTHERMADRYDSESKWLKRIQIFCSAFTAIFASGNLFADAAFFPYATALFSLLTLLTSGYSKAFNTTAMAQHHRAVAADILGHRECLLSLLTDIKDNTISISTIRERRDSLLASLQKLYKTAPHTDGKAYKEAQKRLQKMEDMTFTDDELDKFLPTSLKRSQ